MDIQFPEIIDLSNKINVLTEKVDKIESILTEKYSLIPQWCSLQQAWTLKKGCAWETMRTRRWLHPKGGIADGFVGGVRVFSRETIIEWLYITDDKLAGYHQKYKTGAKPLKETA